MQMLMKEMIPTALKRGDGELLRRLCDLHSETFISVWEIADFQVTKMGQWQSFDANSYPGIVPIEYESLRITNSAIFAIVSCFHDIVDSTNEAVRSTEICRVVRLSIMKFIEQLPRLFETDKNCTDILIELFKLESLRTYIEEKCIEGVGMVISRYLSEIQGGSADESRLAVQRGLIQVISNNVKSVEYSKRQQLNDRLWLQWTEFCSNSGCQVWLIEPMRGCIAGLLRSLGVSVDEFRDVGEISFHQIPSSAFDHIELKLNLISDEILRAAPEYYQTELVRLLSFILASHYVTKEDMLLNHMHFVNLLFDDRERLSQMYCACFAALLYGKGVSNTFADLKAPKLMHWQLFWQLEQTKKLQETTLAEFIQLNALDRLVEVASDSTNKHAQQIIEDNPEFFSDFNNSTNQAVTIESGE